MAIQLKVAPSIKLFIVNAQPTPLDDFAAAHYTDLAEFAEAVMTAFPDVRRT